MKGLLLILAFLLYAQPSGAANYPCQRAAQNKNFVRIWYNYGTLGLDVSKTENEISRVCQDNAAGCFHRTPEKRRIAVSDTFFQAGSEKCVAPTVDIIYDFGGSTIFVTKEYSPCATRAVFRHELQHFMIWKEAKEWFLKDLRYSLNQTVLKFVASCSGVGRCSTASESKIRAVVAQVEKRWNNIENENQVRLDEVDHSVTDEVNYTVCAPYSLKVSSF